MVNRLLATKAVAIGEEKAKEVLNELSLEITYGEVEAVSQNKKLVIFSNTPEHEDKILNLLKEKKVYIEHGFPTRFFVKEGELHQVNVENIDEAEEFLREIPEKFRADIPDEFLEEIPEKTEEKI